MCLCLDINVFLGRKKRDSRDLENEGFIHLNRGIDDNIMGVMGRNGHLDRALQEGTCTSNFYILFRIAQI